jgi:UDP-N-acetylmuramyl pentapeptide phosphotransferase/UDP-N-acetylglucosamine-1-phosphate transferase
MGDSGSLSLGFILGFLAIKCASNNTVIWPARSEALLVPITLLFVPMADVVRVTLYRLIHHRPLFDADKNHIHHKLLRAGLNQHQALISILLLSLIYIGLNILLKDCISSTLIIGIDIVLWIAFHTFVNHLIRKNGQPVFQNQQPNE